MRSIILTLVGGLVLTLGLGQLTQADEQPPVNLEDNRVVLRARTPGAPGRPARKARVSAGPTHCTGLGVTVPCTYHGHPWHHTHQCYVLDGDTTGRWCLDATSILFPFLGLNARRIPPATTIDPPDPGQLARTAVEHMNLQPITIATHPETREQNPNALAYVKWHTWLWNANPDPTSTGPITRTATAGTYTVTATATIDHITWDMGDGTTLTCTTTTPHNPRHNHNTASPNCDHLYTNDGEYLITATTHWTITWHAPGAHGTLTAHTTTTAHITVAEAHMLTIPTKPR